MSRERKLALAALMVASLALISAVAVAVTSYDVPRHVVAGGGGRVQGTNYGVISTMGQGAASGVGGFGTSANYGACAGFWCSGLPASKIYLPFVIRELS